MDELMDTAMVAAKIGVSAATLRYWRHQGEGPKSFTVGRKRVLYKAQDVREWMDAQYATTAVGGVK